MNILLTGGNGFLARELWEYFSKKNNKRIRLLAPDRRTLDVADAKNVELFFEQIDVDVVIHTAIKGGKRLDEDNVDNLFINLAMYQNLLNFSHKFKIMFNFGSGAEFDRRKPIENLKEESVLRERPIDYYGMSKNLITRHIREHTDNIYNLRLYGCFGQFEEKQRLFRSCYDRLICGEDAIIDQDKYMDYFYVQDVGRVIEHIINHRKEKIPRDINLCYSEKYRLSDHAERIRDLTSADPNVIISSKGLGNAYTGDASELEKLNISLLGIEEGVQQCLTSWNKS